MHLLRFFLRVSTSETSHRREGGYRKWKKSSGFISLLVSFRGLSFCPPTTPRFNFSEEEDAKVPQVERLPLTARAVRNGNQMVQPRRRMIRSEKVNGKVLLLLFE
ncbi:hypothetical protein CDAR_250731 [Caerostris darwini]|uniref:Uncharacterized protein n=1 Tax=Caerostris darwini TaxID=1538125 RepID=A0AAV4NUP7_9ARAC|nr:hypothetical protein CDAR_250731 [Caerostris darwini]